VPTDAFKALFSLIALELIVISVGETFSTTSKMVMVNAFSKLKPPWSLVLTLTL
jgi:hypothetical protein